MADINIEEMSYKYNLTPEELDDVKKRHSSEKFTEETLARFIYNFRVTNSPNVAAKSIKDISFDELNATWATVKDAKEGELYAVKQELLSKSEAVVEGCSNAENLTISAAPELSQWLKINDSLNNEETASRNQALAQRIEQLYGSYDKENGLENLSPKDAKRISKISNELSERYADFNPFAVDEKGNLLVGYFKTSEQFYKKLSIENITEEKISKEEYITNMIDLAKREAINHLSIQDGFDKLSKEDQDKLFYKSCAEYMEQGSISVLVSELTSRLSEEQRNKPETLDRNRARARDAFYNALNAPRYAVSNTSALSAYFARLQNQVDLTKRISDKTNNLSFWGKIKAKKKQFAKKYPKTYAALKIVGIMGINMVAGGAGLAVYSTYCTIKAIKQANDERKKTNSDKNLLKYICTNPRHLISISSNVAGVVLSGISGLSGLDANGLIGQSMNHGIGQGLENMGNTISNFASNFRLSNIKETFSDGNLLSGGSEKLSGLRKAFSPESGLVFARTLRTVGTSVATLGVDIAEMMKKENKGKRGKMLRNALGKVLLTGAVVYATTPVGDASASVETDTPAIPHPDTPINDDYTVNWEEQMKTWQVGQNPQVQPEPENYVEDHALKIGDEQRIAENTEQTSAAVELSDDTKFWNSRIDQFLDKTGELDAVKAHVYGMIDNGEIKLPEGIESKEEYLYKMTMAMEQRPDDLAQTLGVGHKTTLAWEKDITKMTAEDFNKISQCFDNEYDDRGNFLGKDGSGVVHNNTEKQQPTEQPQEQLQEQLQEQPSETPVVPQVEPVVKDEQYYQDMQDFVDGKGQAHSLGKDLKEALVRNDDTVEKALDRSMDIAVEEGVLTEQKADELENVTRYVLDEKDNGELNGKIQDDELSKRELRQGMREVQQTVNSMENNANEKIIAENAEKVILTNHTPEQMPSTFVEDTNSSQFYKGMSNIIDRIQNSDAPMQDVMKEAIHNGELSQQQVMMMNARYGELVVDGSSPEGALAKMEKDYNHMTKYHEAQEYAKEQSEKSLQRIKEKTTPTTETLVEDKPIQAKEPNIPVGRNSVGGR